MKDEFGKYKKKTMTLSFFISHGQFYGQDEPILELPNIKELRIWG